MRYSSLGLNEAIKLLTHKLSPLLKKVRPKSLDGLNTGSIQVWENISSDGEKELSYELDGLMGASSVYVWIYKRLALSEITT